MDSQRDLRLPTPAGSEGSAPSTRSRHSATAYSQQMASPVHGSAQAQPPLHSQPSTYNVLEPIDAGELAISSLPSLPRSAAHISPFSLSSGDPIDAFVSHYTSSFPLNSRQGAMSVPPSLSGVNYVHPSLDTLVNPSSAIKFSSKPGISASQLVPAEERERVYNPTSPGGFRPPTVGVENVTYRYHSNFSTFNRAQNEGDGRFGPRRAPYTMPARLQPLPEEDAATRPDIGTMRNEYEPNVPSDGVGSLVGRLGKLYILDERGHVNPAVIPLPKSNGTSYTSPSWYNNRPLPQPPTIGPPANPRQPSQTFIMSNAQTRPPSVVPSPTIRQPQPSRPFVVPEPPRPPSSHPVSHTLMVDASLVGSPAAQSGPQMPRSASVTSWRRISRPPSVIDGPQRQSQQPPYIPQTYTAQVPVQGSHVDEHQYAPQYHQPTVHYPTPLQPPDRTSLTIVATTGTPNIKDIPELTGRDKFPVWCVRVIGELKRLGLYKHIVDPLPGSELDYVPGEQPTYPPNPITIHASNDAKEYVGIWYGNDGLCHYVVTAKLAPAILAEIPKRDELCEGRPACARTVWNYLRNEFGGGDVNAVMVAWDKVKTTKATTDQEVNEMISKWESAYNEMVLIDRKPPLHYETYFQ